MPSAATPAQAAEEGLRRQEERERWQRQQLPPGVNVLTPEAGHPPAGALPEETPCFVIHEITLTGADARRFSWLKGQAQPFLHRCIGIAGLRRIAAALDAALIDRGYATSRLTLPEQNLRDGVLTLHVHAGRVAEVRMIRAPVGAADTSRTPDTAWGTWRNAFPVGAGEVLNVRDLEQGVEQMTRLPSQTVTTEIAPGPEPDSSLVYIERQAATLGDRLRGGATLDNSGGSTLGRSQFSGYFALDNPLGVNDILTLTAASNIEQPDPDHRSQSLGINYSLPLRYSTLSLAQTYSRYAQIVQGTTARFLSSGKSETAEARLHHTALRTRSAKFGLYAAISSRRASSFLDDVELIVQRRRTTHLAAGVTVRKLFGNADVDLDLGYRQGMSWNGAEDDFPTAADGGLTLRPKIWTFTAAFHQAFGFAERAFNYSAGLSGQRTRDITLTIDQFAIGSRWTVRGFDGDGVLLAESGLFWRNEVSSPLGTIRHIATAAYVGLDYGRVWGANNSNLAGGSLAGAAAGLRGRWKALQFDAALAAPISKPDGFQTQRWNPYLALTSAF